MLFVKNFFKRFINEYLKDVLIYSFLFLCIFISILYVFGLYNKSFIWTTDGISQHFITIKYFRELLINFFKTGNFNTFVWNLGYGLDMFANLSYYCFGDILGFLVVKVEESNLESFYNLALGIRMWFIGISFILYCRHRKIEGIGIVLGALMYTFCARVYVLNFYHPYMMNASIILPLLLIGVERSIKENKSIFLVFISVLTFLQGFYFAYMMFVIVAIYGILFVFFTYRRRVYLAIFMLLKTLIYGVIALGISSFILYPSILQFLDSTRINDLRQYIYSLDYYHNSFNMLTTSVGSFSTFVGVAPLFLIGMAVCSERKDNYPELIISILLITALFIPKVSSVFVAFSYPANRWTFTLCFFLSYLTATTFTKNFFIGYHRMKKIMVVIILYLCGAFYVESSSNLLSLANVLLISIFILLFIKNKKNGRRKLYSVISAVVLSLYLGYSVFFHFAPEGKMFLNQFVTNNMANTLYETNYEYTSNFKEAIDYVKEIDSSFYLIGKYPNVFQSHNLGLYFDYNSINYYYSINSNKYSSLSKDLENSAFNISYEIGEFNNRTRITTLLGTKYFITNSKKYVPYDYKLIKSFENNTYLYKNNNYLPFAALYVDRIDLEEYEELSEYEKEIVMLKTTVLSSDSGIKKFKEYKKYIDMNNNVNEVNAYYHDEYVTNKKIKVKDINKDFVKLETNSISNSEVYLKISGLKYNVLKQNDYIDAKIDKFDNLSINKFLYENKWAHLNKSFSIIVKSNNRSVQESFRDDVVDTYYYEDNTLYINLGYFKNWDGNIELRFNKIGNYSYDKIEVIAVNFKNYQSDIKDLKRSNFNLIDYSNGYMKASISPECDGIIQFNTNYSKGWNVYVDGKKVNTFESNKYFLGIEISSGYHEIELVYEIPNLKEGINITKISIMVFEIVIWIEMFIKFIYLKIKRRK